MAKQFTLKTHGAKLYKWSPLPNNKKAKDNRGAKPYFCTAIAGSHGEDWITTYCSDNVVVNGILKKEAYVECDYVE